jgi:GNAT superfamily N-acetyltransferase
MLHPCSNVPSGQEDRIDELEVMIRRTRSNEAAALPEIERSAARAFTAIAELAWLVDGDVLSEAQHRRFIAMGGSWLALRDGRAIGFACAELVGTDLHIWEVAVRHEQQGLGVGRRLLGVVVAAARTAAASRITLTTFRDVPWNEAFYRSLGFETVPAGELDARLRRLLELEAAAGLPLQRRCAMRLVLTRRGDAAGGLPSRR